MANEQMGMPAAAPSMEEMAVFDQMRQGISPKEFSDEMLASASQVDPQAVAEFTQELQGLDMPPEVLDALNDVVDEILANPERYAELRAQYMEQGLPEEILPEQFDPQFFTALNMAIDQMIAAPTGVQAFAQGGIAELKPIAKAIASYGRNGDTMLAHITPAEARMLRRRGGSGTINPHTGLPEFFLKKLWKAVTAPLRAVGKAVKKFASSTVGRLVATVALGFFLGPAAASMLGVSSAAGVAAISGFVGSAGSTLLGGGSLRDALKAGAIGGLTAGAGAGIMGGSGAFQAGSYTGPTTVGGQWDKVKDMFTPGPAPGASAISPTGQVAGQMPTGAAPAGTETLITPQTATTTAAPTQFEAPGYNPQQMAAVSPSEFGAQAPGYRPSTIGESLSTIKEGVGLGEGPASWETTKKGIGELFSPTKPTTEQLNARATELVNASPKLPNGSPMLPFDTALKQATSELSPGLLRSYGPAAVAGLGTLALTGGFKPQPVQGGPITQSLMTPAMERIRREGSGKQYYVQGLPGVKYDEAGIPVYGESLPFYTPPDYSNSYALSPANEGIMRLPTMYTSPAGAMGSRTVAQPYNTAAMYTNLMPLGYADGGTVTDLYRSVLRREPSPAEIDNWKSQFGDTIDERERAVFREAAGPELASQRTAEATTAAQQKAARDAMEQQKAMRRAQGYGTMYANINSGLSAMAPEVNPVNSYFKANPDVQAEYYRSASPLSQAEFAQQHFTQYGKNEGRAAPGSYGDEQFGARNRVAQLQALQDTYGPMLQNQAQARMDQAGILGVPAPVLPSPYTPQPVVDTRAQQAAQQAAEQFAKQDEYYLQQKLGQLRNPQTGQKAAADGWSGSTIDDLRNFMAARGMTPQQHYALYGQKEGLTYGLPTQQDTLYLQQKLAQLGQDQGAAANWMNATPGELQGYMASLGMTPLQHYQRHGQSEGLTYGPTSTKLLNTESPSRPPSGNLAPITPSPRDSLGNDMTQYQPRVSDDGKWVYSGGEWHANETVSVPRHANQTVSVLGMAPEQGAAQFMNRGGIAALAQGGYPRMNGQISGPGTEKSDSIPAMLSDGEFVMTAKAVRGAGNGSRREGAKKMYKLMHQLERNAQRG